jgi:predicted signal transduction protein with EAL and GGDEF domain
MQTLADHHLPPGNLCLEMTESMLMEHEDSAIALLGQLRDGGVHLAIDDFGTGYSSLAALRRLPADQLKIDRSFISSLPDDAGTIAWAIVRLGHTLGMTVLAEGVETTAQHEQPRQIGCAPHKAICSAGPYRQRRSTGSSPPVPPKTRQPGDGGGLLRQFPVLAKTPRSAWIHRRDS